MKSPRTGVAVSPGKPRGNAGETQGIPAVSRGTGGIFSGFSIHFNLPGELRESGGKWGEVRENPAI